MPKKARRILSNQLLKYTFPYLAAVNIVSWLASQSNDGPVIGSFSCTMLFTIQNYYTCFRHMKPCKKFPLTFTTMEVTSPSNHCKNRVSSVCLRSASFTALIKLLMFFLKERREILDTSCNQGFYI